MTVSCSTADVMVDPVGMPLKSNRSRPRRVPNEPSRPAVNPGVPPLLLSGALLRMKVSATGFRLMVSADVANGSRASTITAHIRMDKHANRLTLRMGT